MTTAANEFLKSQIAEAVTKALGLPINSIDVKNGELSIKMEIAGDGANNLFWKAVLEQQEE